jgi:MoxR-like ATPase
LNEAHVSVDSVTYPLLRLFIVIATENPLNSYYTFRLPQSQLDRLLMRIRIGYPEPSEWKKRRG